MKRGIRMVRAGPSLRKDYRREQDDVFYFFTNGMIVVQCSV